jgi:hypothetical protein
MREPDAWKSQHKLAFSKAPFLQRKEKHVCLPKAQKSAGQLLTLRSSGEKIFRQFDAKSGRTSALEVTP